MSFTKLRITGKSLSQLLTVLGTGISVPLLNFLAVLKVRVVSKAPSLIYACFCFLVFSLEFFLRRGSSAGGIVSRMQEDWNKGRRIKAGYLDGALGQAM